MSRIKGMQELFKRHRRPGDIVFAWFFLAVAAFLFSQLATQSPWNPEARIFSQPAFWPTVSVVLMVVFAALHLISSALSQRLVGRLAELGFWLRSAEYALWFMAYVFMVPWAGYLPTTILFGVGLALRAGYRSKRMIISVVLLSIVIVVIFKSFLQVKIPGGEIYQYLPGTLRSFMLTYL